MIDRRSFLRGAAAGGLALAENTIVIFSSDNGGAIKNTYNDGTNHLHARQPPNGPLRGQKGTLFEGGHRVPLIARWPGRIPAATTAHDLIGQVDMLPTLAAAAGIETRPEDGPDAVNVLPALLSANRGPCRDHLVTQLTGPLLAVRCGPWKMIPAGNVPLYLFNLEQDLSESNNLARKNPQKARELMKLLRRIKADGLRE